MNTTNCPAHEWEAAQDLSNADVCSNCGETNPAGDGSAEPSKPLTATTCAMSVRKDGGINSGVRSCVRPATHVSADGRHVCTWHLAKADRWAVRS